MREETAPLSPVPLYFSSLSLLRTALHYLNAWNRLNSYILGDLGVASRDDGIIAEREALLTFAHENPVVLF